MLGSHIDWRTYEHVVRQYGLGLGDHSNMLGSHMDDIGGHINKLHVVW